MIRIDRVYSGPGLTNLPPGVYDPDDPALKGRGQYLLDARIAVRIVDQAAPVKQAAPVDELDDDDEDSFVDDEDVPAFVAPPMPNRPAKKKR